MKKILLSATALMFSVAMFAQTTGSAPVAAKPSSKPEMAQNASRTTAQTSEMKSEKKKHCCAGKSCAKKGKEDSAK